VAAGFRHLKICLVNNRPYLFTFPLITRL
jgi:hypothetical protein